MRFFKRRPRKQFYQLMQAIDAILDDNERLKEGYREWGGLCSRFDHSRIKAEIARNHRKIEQIGRYAVTLYGGKT